MTDPVARGADISFVEADRDDWKVVTVIGELDIAAAAEARERFGAAAGSGHRLLIDLSGVSFVDSSGLSALVAAYRTASAAGNRVRVVAPSSKVRAVIDIAQLTELLDVYSDPRAALET